ncbi:MAG: SsrA-binding protein SmpB [Candidatus Comchoanobacterales bacterium]
MSDTILIDNRRKAKFNYHWLETFECGIVLEGWEIKSLRQKHGQLAESYVTIVNNEAWLLQSQITPLATIPAYLNPEPNRRRKLLLHRKEIDTLLGAVTRKKATIIPLTLHLRKQRAKLSIALCVGKNQRDKRQDIKEREWKRDQGKALKEGRY